MKPKTETTKMLAGKLYRSADPELVADTKRAQRLDDPVTVLSLVTPLRL